MAIKVVHGEPEVSIMPTSGKAKVMHGEAEVSIMPTSGKAKIVHAYLEVSAYRIPNRKRQPNVSIAC
jgi:hypothetical protein